MAKKSTAKKSTRRSTKVDCCTPSLSSKRQELKWQAEDAVRTLMRAEEIKKDPKLLAAAKKQMIAQKSALEKVLK